MLVIILVAESTLSSFLQFSAPECQRFEYANDRDPGRSDDRRLMLESWENKASPINSSCLHFQSCRSRPPSLPRSSPLARLRVSIDWGNPVRLPVHYRVYEVYAQYVLFCEIRRN